MPGPWENVVMPFENNGGRAPETDSYWEKVRELISLLDLQEQLIKSGNWASVERLQDKLLMLQQEIDRLPVPLVDTSLLIDLAQALRRAKEKVDRQLVVVSILREETAADLREVYYFRERVKALESVCRPRSQSRIDLKG